VPLSAAPASSIKLRSERLFNSVRSASGPLDSDCLAMIVESTMLILQIDIVFKD
jgi:hypothetical protein